MVIQQTQSERLDQVRPCCHSFAVSLPQEDTPTKQSWASPSPDNSTAVTNGGAHVQATESPTPANIQHSTTLMPEDGIEANRFPSKDAKAENPVAEKLMTKEVKEDVVMADVIKVDAIQAAVIKAEVILDAQHVTNSMDTNGCQADDTKSLDDGNCPSDTTGSTVDDDIPIPSSWTDHKEKTILGPYNYITSEPGKEFRTRLLESFNAWLKVSPESFACIVNVIRMLHNASLLVDDIQDNSELRRGRPVAHSVFGVAQTINSANFVYFLALAELKKLSNFKEAIGIFTTEMLALHRGQGMDLFWRDTLTCPTEDDYLEMVSNKTGGLFRLALKLMQAESDVDVDCMPFVDLLGLIFQITDDYKNLSNTDYIQQKGYCEDLTEGKFSFPVVHSIRAEPTNQELLHILKQKPTDNQIKRHAVECMERTGSFMYTRRRVDALLARAKLLATDLDIRCGSTNVDAIFALVVKVARI